jgi:hypothetical protein
MYGKGGNHFVEPHGVGNTTQPNTPRFICAADVQGESGRIGRCGTRVEDGMCCHNQQFHLKRPKPFTQRIADGDHLPMISQLASVKGTPLHA